MADWRRGVALFALVGRIGVHPAHAGSLADVFRRPAFAHLGLAPLAPALATTVAAEYPVASASSSVVYEYNPTLETMERRSGITGPLFGERAETIGRGLFDVNLTYTYIHLTSIDGEALDSLPSRRTAGGRMLTVRVPGSIELRDGRFTNILPVQVTADIDVTAHQFAFSATYGVTPRLDLNVTVPLLHTSLGLAATGVAPDPRFPAFALAGGRTFSLQPSASAAATGVGDVLLRAKYLLHDGAPIDVAAALALALPSGSEDDFQGAGTVRVAPALILSRVFARRFEPFINLGVECNAADVDRSVVRWAVGGAVEVGSELTAIVTFLGRNELGAQADPIPEPFFFQIERNDIYDASLGVRWRFAERGVVSANVIVALNRQGLRAPATPALNVEYVF